MVEKGNVLDERIRQLDETCNLVVGEENAFRLIMTNESEYENLTRLILIMRYFQNVCSGNSLIDGLGLIDCSRGIMLTDKTKFELEDAGPYESCENGNSFFLTERDGGKCLEYVKRYDPRGKDGICNYQGQSGGIIQQSFNRWRRCHDRKLSPYQRRADFICGKFQRTVRRFERAFDGLVRDGSEI